MSLSSPNVDDEEYEPFVELLYNSAMHFLLMKTWSEYAALHSAFYAFPFYFFSLVGPLASVFSNVFVLPRFLFYFCVIHYFL